MKFTKYLIYILAIVSSYANAYQFTVYNATAGDVYVELHAVARYQNPRNVIAPGKSWSTNTHAYCVNRVTAIGRSGPVQGLHKTHNVSGIACMGRSFTVRGLGSVRDVRGTVDSAGRPVFLNQSIAIEQ
ncbi:hypothetical protein KG892_01475 [Vermiphilus pyriformis]|uniref:Uncharacterized protein n=1 Tax=candidate division TM6 bacterium JCVI TM6SC1 TaxID=1306947 RepID=A0A0D2GQJ3_9BACT|nr:hypothetical protein J120_01670 [candidate division TM6 bacterium JCVI TM6SC1]UNE35675.1 MAG: hypothetical protein KG892_01475 [Vermiphilus pyriformis]